MKETGNETANDSFYDFMKTGRSISIFSHTRVLIDCLVIIFVAVAGVKIHKYYSRVMLIPLARVERFAVTMDTMS